MLSVWPQSAEGAPRGVSVSPSQSSIVRADMPAAAPPDTSLPEIASALPSPAGVLVPDATFEFLPLLLLLPAGVAAPLAGSRGLSLPRRESVLEIVTVTGP